MAAQTNSNTEQRKPDFEKWSVDKLKPNDNGINLRVKVLDINPKLNRLNLDGSRTRIDEAVVGDETGAIVFTVRGEDQIAIVNEAKEADGVLIIRNAKIEMFRNYMRLGIDKWGLIEHAKNSALQGEVKKDNNKSLIEYELVDQNH